MSNLVLPLVLYSKFTKEPISKIRKKKSSLHTLVVWGKDIGVGVIRKSSAHNIFKL